MRGADVQGISFDLCASQRVLYKQTPTKATHICLYRHRVVGTRDLFVRNVLKKTKIFLQSYTFASIKKGSLSTVSCFFFATDLF